MTDRERDGAASPVFAFGVFEFDPQRRLLSRNGTEVRITARAHDVLLYLLEHRGQLATKAQLLATAWRGVVVEESSLSQAIHELRSVFGEKPRERRYIATVPGRGYQFVADVRELERGRPREAALAETARVEPAPLPASLPPRAPSGRTSAPAIAASAAAAAAWGLAAVVLLWPSHVERAERAASSLTEMRTVEARYYLARRGPGDVDRAEASVRAALREDPSYAGAWSSLASVHAIRSYQSTPETRHVELGRMRDAAARALRLDPKDPQALMRLAMYHWEQGEDTEARKLLDAAAEAAPDDPLVLSVQAGLAAFNGRFDAAARLQQRVVRQAPLSAVDRGNLGHFLYAAGRTEEARAEFKAVLDLVPSPAASSIARDAAVGIARIDVAAGRIDSARRMAESIPEGLERDYCLALIEHASSDRAAADAALDRFRARATDEHAYRLAEIHAFRGEFDAAFHWLTVGGRALAAQPQIRSDRNWEARTSPLLAQVRHDPRWQDWVAANL